MEVAITLAVQVIAKLFCLAKGARCGAKHAILLPSGCGKSTLVKNLNSKDKIFIDLEELLFMSLSKEQREHHDKLKTEGNLTSLKIYIYPIFKALLKDILAKFKGKESHIFISDVQLAEFLGLKVSAYVPNETFFKDILAHSSAEDREQMQASRIEILHRFGKRVNVFGSWEGLNNLIKEDVNADFGI